MEHGGNPGTACGACGLPPSRRSGPQERPFGLGTASIGSAALTATLSARAERGQIPRRLILAQTLIGAPAAAQLLVTSIKISGVEVLTGDEGVPFESFTADATTPWQLGSLDNCAGGTVSVTITASVVPGGATTREFSGVVFGESVNVPG